MADTITYFGKAMPATYPDGSPIIVNGRPLLIPEKLRSADADQCGSLQQSGGLPASWFLRHYLPSSSGDPQRQAGYSGGFDPRFTDAGNYVFGLSAAAAGSGPNT